MSGYYPPNQHIPPHYYNVNPNAVPNPNAPNAPPMMLPDGSVTHGLPLESPVYQTVPGPFVQYGEQQIQQGYLGPYEDMPGAMGDGPPMGGRMRASLSRRPASGDAVKHRRTRSGCFTCRNRRVKCDETHPICDSKS
ncbi:hypothetical protein BDV96DRAFT_123884 [Lophiotrema nucula]|uniref:Zn(2)-C6 fungal-type domain-containing protein n=1 Tax=Lophiotrema nucula TaxID=690887 RepID=A0A6A5Z1U7_9PLEO|nr:hypothetical protein BDV96DRAFT_123884 [Lophiotrema nucula]